MITYTQDSWNSCLKNAFLMSFSHFHFAVAADESVYEFGITSLVNKKDFLQRGDLVQFQIERTRDDKERATEIRVVRKKLRSTVDAIKGQFGFLNHEVEDGKLKELVQPFVMKNQKEFF